MNFSFMPPRLYLHYAGVFSDHVTYVHDYDLVQMSVEQRVEFSHLLHQLSNTPGVAVSYDTKKRRYCIYFPTPIITTMDTRRVEYPE